MLFRSGVQILCLQEIFNGPYFCPGQDRRWYAAAEPIPDGPTTKAMQELARKHNMVIVVPLYEEAMRGVYYNSAAVVDADGTYLGKYRKQHIPQTAGFWEKYFFKPGDGGYPVFKTKFATIGVYICYDRHFPEGARCLGLNGAEIVFNPSATVAGLCAALLRDGLAVGLQTCQGEVAPEQEAQPGPHLLRLRSHLAELVAADRPPPDDWPLPDEAWLQLGRDASERARELAAGRPLSWAVLREPAEIFLVEFEHRVQPGAGPVDAVVRLTPDGELAGI